MAGNKSSFRTTRGDFHLAPKTAKGDAGRITPGRDYIDLKRSKCTSPTPKRDNSIKATYEEDDETLYGDSNTTLNRDRNTHITYTRDDQYSIRASLYEVSATWNPDEFIRKCVTIFKSFQRRAKKYLLNKESRLSELKYTRGCKTLIIIGQGAYFLGIAIGMKNNIMHLVICLLDIKALSNSINEHFMPSHWLSQIRESSTKPF